MAGHLPSAKQLRDTLGDVLGRTVSLEPRPPFVPGPMVPACFAVFVDDSLTIRAIVVTDLPLGARLGGAIGLMPVNGVDEAITSGVLTPTLAENLHEVFNILSGTFNVPEADHVRLHASHLPGAEIPQHVLAHALTLGRRADLGIEIAGYGRGRLSVVLCG